MAYAFARANGHEAAIGFEEGVAVFSRYPLRRVYLRQLSRSRNPFVRRLGLGAMIETRFGRLLAFSAHLGLLPRQNASHLLHLHRWVSAIAGPHPAVIAGDFNAHEHTARIRRLRSRWLDTFRHLHPHADGATHEWRYPGGGVLRRHRLDYVFLHPDEGHWRVLEARHLDAPGGPHSDHRAVLVKLAASGSRGTPHLFADEALA
jgi:endonuclease/exonuclease/phosphatase family metal-dependent hydrolase